MKKSSVIPSPADKRDYCCGAAVELTEVNLPEEYSVWQPPVENQGDTGNCVAQALANIYECYYHSQHNIHRDFSVGYIYGTSQSYGMMAREACATICKDGDVFRELFECFAENPACFYTRQSLGDKLKKDAYVATEYIRINTLVELKAFIFKYKLPVLITAKTRWFGNIANGYHAVACYGWNEANKLLYTNSWGTGGILKDGRGQIDFNLIDEIWGVVFMNNQKFTDIAGHWAEKAICDCTEEHILNGYPDGTFAPDKPITRAEFAQAISNLLKALEGKK